MKRLARAGHGELRFSHGFVVQHLIEGALPIGERVRRVGLSERGWRAVEATRRARRAVAAELTEQLGERRVETMRRSLLAALQASGGMAAVRARRIPQVR
jgi:hypothetical protein